MLDRELLLSALGSGRPTATAATTQLHTTTTTSNWIDANSNAALLGTTLYQRTTDNEFKKQMTDVRHIFINPIHLNYQLFSVYLAPRPTQNAKK